MTRVYLLRHADVENPRRVLYGHLPGFPLSERGRAQAVDVGKRLRDRGIARILHSPLERALETAHQLGGRVVGVVHRVAEEHPDEASLLVSHADPLQAAWLLMDGRPRTEH